MTIKSVKIVRSKQEGKKYTAKFYDEDKKKVKTTHFGQRGADDFTKKTGADEEQKKRYLDRHRANENWNDKTSAGALSRWILWNKKSFRESINDYKRRFNLE